MSRFVVAPLSVALFLAAGSSRPQQAVEDNIRAAIQRYYAALQREDIEAVVAAWSASAERRPAAENLKALFDTGDDEYSVEIRSVTIKAAEATARIVVHRVRILSNAQHVVIFRYPSTTIFDETLVREGDSWKFVRERSATDTFADELLAAPSQARAQLLADNADLVNQGLRVALTFRAQQFVTRQQFTAALEPFELALTVARKADDRTGEIETLQNIANAYYYMRDFAKSAEAYQDELNSARAADNEMYEASAILGLATVAYVRGDYTAALASYREALAIYERREEDPSIGRTLVSVGNIQFLQGEYDTAAATYQHGLDLLLKGSDFPGASMARSGLGRVFAAQGDLGAALEVYGQVLSDARARRMRSDEAPALESIGELHYRLHNTAQARSAFTGALRLAEEAQDWEGAGRLLGDVGLTELIAGHLDAAVTAYTDSRARYEKAKRPDGVARAWVGLGFAQAAREKYDEAIAAYKTAIDWFDSQGRNEEAGRAWLGLSLAQSGRGDAEPALESARKVRSIAETIVNDDLNWRAATREGEALRKLSKVDEAQRAFEAAIASIQRIAGDAATSADARTQLEDSASAWAGLAFVLMQKGDASGALVAAEARRAHLRRMALAPFEHDINRNESTAEQEAERQVDRDIVSVRAQLRAERGAAHPDAARFDRLRQQLSALVSARTTQQAQLYTRVPDLQLWRGLRPPPTLDELASVLTDPRVLASEFIVADDEVLVLAAARGEQGIDVTGSVVPLKRRVLGDAIGRALEPAALADAAEWRARTGHLGAALLGPLSARLSDHDRLVVIPDDLLWQVPFEALPLDDRDVMSVARVSYAGSLASLAVRTARSTSSAEQPLLGELAGPDIAAALRAQLALTSPGWTPADPAAQVAAARAVESVYDATARVAVGAEATEAAARGFLRDSDIVEFATPLSMSGPSPLLSAVLLAGAGPTHADDGRFELREWFEVQGRARTVVLRDGSGFAASGSVFATEALDWAAASVGVSSLVVARWPFDASLVDSMLKSFHEQVAHGASPADALATASANARKASNSGPGAWAGLRLIGR